MMMMRRVVCRVLMKVGVKWLGGVVCPLPMCTGRRRPDGTRARGGLEPPRSTTDQCKCTCREPTRCGLSY